VSKDNDTLFSTYKIPEKIVYDNNYSIRSIILQWDQYYFSKFKQGRFSYSQLRKTVPWIDTLSLVQDELKNYVSVLIYSTPDKKHLIFDRDHDFDFTNDSIYTFSLQNTKEQSTIKWRQYVVTIHDSFEIVTDGKILMQNINLFVFPFKTPNLKISGNDDYFFQYAQPIKLLKATGPDSLQLYLLKDFLDTTKYISIKIRGEEGKIRDKYYKPGNSFTYKSNSYIIDSLNKEINSIRLKKLNYEDSALAVGREINLYFSDHLFGLNQNGQLISTNSHKGRYLLIDFWATWCIPCIESLPTLSEFYHTYGNDSLYLLSISVDDPSETQKVKQFIKDHKIVWDVMMPGKESYPKASGFTQSGVPKFVLLDPEGRIIKIANGLYELPAIRIKLESLFSKKK
jgi:thiol-disulfide isomerase/thioredoxin